MTVKEAIDAIQKNVIDLEALEIAVRIMEEHVEHEEGYNPVLDVYMFETIRSNNDAHIRTRCGYCNELLRVDIYPKEVWNEYMKDRYKPKLPNFCSHCGNKVRYFAE